MAKKIKKSAFNLSYSNALSFNIGDLVPVYLEDVIPGDHFVIQPDFFVKFAPMVFPILQRLEAKIKYFFVPNRIMWRKWESFITGGPAGTKVIAPPYGSYADLMTLDSDLFDDNTLADYLGFPDFVASTGVSTTANTPPINLIPFYAYQLVWSEYFRDETLAYDFRNELKYAIDPSGDTEDSEYDAQDFATYLSSYPSATSVLSPLFTLRKVAWKKDYFTTASPWAQRGASVQIPSNLRLEDALHIDSFTSPPDSPTLDGEEADISGVGWINTDNDVVASKFAVSNKLTDSEPLGTLNDLYKASALQRFLQKSISGSRYIEQILNFFGVRVPDYRLNRPQYLGEVKKVVQISEILQTSETTDTSALGTYAGKASVGGVGKPIHFKAYEHGWIIGLMFVRPDATYFQGLRKNLSRQDRFDYFWPEFQGIGEQPILYQELYAQHGTNAWTDKVFGYTERFADYKHHANECHGSFRSSMDSWTMARKFSGAPGLNASILLHNLY